MKRMLLLRLEQGDYCRTKETTMIELEYKNFGPFIPVQVGDTAFSIIADTGS